jgi:nucleolar protein 58
VFVRLVQVKHMQTRENAADTDFEGILEEEVAADLKEIATISMGTEISAEDMSNITSLCDQVGCSSPHCHISS